MGGIKKQTISILDSLLFDSVVVYILLWPVPFLTLSHKKSHQKGWLFLCELLLFVTGFQSDIIEHETPFVGLFFDCLFCTFPSPVSRLCFNADQYGV